MKERLWLISYYLIYDYLNASIKKILNEIF